MSAAPPSAPGPDGRFAAPPRECDIVIKGGITSGIVYPPAVLELAPTFRFRSIGGTSAGAIAAALTAAAEYGRERGGFEKLAALNAWLGRDRNLLDLFQAPAATRPLLRLLLAWQRRTARASGPPAAGRPRRSWLPPALRVGFVTLPGVLRDALPLRYWTGTVVGGVLGGTIDVLLARGIVPAGHPLARTVVALLLPVAFVGAYLGSALACGSRLWRLLTHALPEQGFGVCTGRTVEGANVPALTDWLHERIQDLAGLAPDDPPLTVGMLSGKPVPGVAAPAIALQMVTTSLSLGRPFVLPIEDERLLFREPDFERLFPPAIVRHLIEAGRRSPHAGRAPAGYHPMPRAEDAPVLLLARMSSSFPVLLSAVPLHLPGEAGGEPRRVWFSDGGITSNFPIHFFDARLPSRPTFGIDLTGAHPGAPAVAGTPGGPGPAVSLPATGRPLPMRPDDIASLGAFLEAIWNTARATTPANPAPPAADSAS
ncbi:MAG TPA: hypothetical protein VFK69_03855 [Candidatus Eisenbacteria bacterium]|nr:hypothetical protein [Candidatus Eisenbacteria bacterium]